jgi:RNA polymerase sigma-70 factor (ECF subfamily)
LTGPAIGAHHVLAMASRVPAHGTPREQAPRVLGDLLYADTATPRASEADWIGLVRAIAKGDEQALHALFERMHRLVFSLALRITNNRETAEEVTLDVFHEVWTRAARFDPAGGPVVGWIMNLARSRAIDRLRFDQRKKRGHDHAEVPPPATVASDPHDTLALEERGRLLREALTVLTPAERLAIETAFFSELTYDEVATRLNEPLGTIKTRVRSGLGKLRECLGGIVKAL